jgi:hypothetical protein
MAKPNAFRAIPRRQRNAVRTIARDVLFELEPAGGRPFDWDKAADLLSTRIPRAVGSIWVAIAIQLAWALIKYWLENRVKEPAAIYELGEPGGDDEAN